MSEWSDEHVTGKRAVRKECRSAVCLASACAQRWRICPHFLMAELSWLGDAPKDNLHFNMTDYGIINVWLVDELANGNFDVLRTVPPIRFSSFFGESYTNCELICLAQYQRLCLAVVPWLMNINGINLAFIFIKKFERKNGVCINSTVGNQSLSQRSQYFRVFNVSLFFLSLAPSLAPFPLSSSHSRFPGPFCLSRKFFPENRRRLAGLIITKTFNKSWLHHISDKI